MNRTGRNRKKLNGWQKAKETFPMVLTAEAKERRRLWLSHWEHKLRQLELQEAERGRR